MRRGASIALGLAVLVCACASPEASRARGQPGADPGNRPAVVDLHGKTDPAHDTPAVGKAVEAERR